MIKDPLCENNDAYDILGLEPNAQNVEIIQALPKFMTNPKNFAVIEQGQIAHQKLLNPTERIKIDINFYPLREIDPNEIELKNLSENVTQLVEVPCGDYYDLLLEQDLKSCPIDFKDLECREIEILEKNGFESLTHLNVEIIFDK